jgi:proteasome lid subunit RPN8/RPN11
MNIKEALQFFINSSLFAPKVEICGLLGIKNGEYCSRILRNKHPEPQNYFSIDPLEYLRFSQEFEMVAVFHSHVIGDSQPSDFDKVNSDNTTVPFLIYSLPEKKFSLFEPENHSCDVKELKENI